MNNNITLSKFGLPAVFIYLIQFPWREDCRSTGFFFTITAMGFNWKRIGNIIKTFFLKYSINIMTETRNRVPPN